MDVTRTERLLNLVIALLAARTPVSRSIIQSSVAGYDPNATSAAFERMFERDKDELRSMGIPIETVTDAHGEVLGYLVDSHEYGMPALDLSFEEISVISLAAQVWDEAVLAPAAITGVRKLESQLTNVGTATTLRSFGSLAASEAAFLPLLRAVRERKIVRFNYHKPGSATVAERQVEPWSLRCADGHWYVTGLDCERQERRSFRLSRIAGKVTVTGQPCSTDIHSIDLELGFEPHDDIEAMVRLPHGSGMEIRRRLGSEEIEEELWRVRGPHHEIVSLVLRGDPQIVVEGPPEVVHDVRNRLQELTTVHA